MRQPEPSKRSIKKKTIGVRLELAASRRGVVVVSNRKSFVVLGIDLAGSPRRPTGMCLLRGLRAQTHVAFSDDDILDAVQQAQPDLVPIDAPLSLPKGRRTISDRRGEHFRDCDLDLRRRGIRFFPVTLGPMRMLTERGLALKEIGRASCRERV